MKQPRRGLVDRSTMPTDQGWNLRGRNVQSTDGPIDTRIYLLAFSVLFGLGAAALSGYSYGLSNHAEQLPVIFRLIDAEYLTNDFFVNAASGFGPSHYYSHAFAFVAGYIPIHVAMAAIWLLTFIAVIVITAFAARDIVGSVLGGMIAAILVSLSSPFSLGFDAIALMPVLTPRFLALPFGLFAIWRGIRGQAICAAIASLPAILIHPTLGLETAVLALAAAVANSFWCWRVRRGIDSLQARGLALGILIVGLTSLLWIVPTILTGTSFSSTSDDLVRINAYFRFPHQLVPSTWDMGSWALAAGFAVAVAIALAEFRRRTTNSESGRQERSAIGFATVSTFSLIAVALLGGYVFLELIPTRIAVNAQVFQLVVVAAWLGWILMAGVIAEFVMSGRWRWAALFVVSAASAPTLFVFTAFTFAASKLSGGATFRSKLFFAGIAILIFDTMVLTKVWVGQPTLRDVLLVALGLPVVLMIAVSSRLKPVALAALAGGLVVVSTSLALDREEVLPNNIPFVSSFLAKTQPILTLDQAFRKGESHAEDYTLILAARNSTHADAVFLIPWNWQNWRLFANRAVVVDREAFPFGEGAMEEWYDRYLDIYDEGAGYPDDVTESELLELQRRYGFHYAVVPIGARMSFPVTATSEHWKLVQVAETVP